MAILFALFAMVSFTACSSDDDETPSTEDIKTNIIGMWQWTHVSGWDYDDSGEDFLGSPDKPGGIKGSNNIVVFLTICISYANNCFTL